MSHQQYEPKHMMDNFVEVDYGYLPIVFQEAEDYSDLDMLFHPDFIDVPLTPAEEEMLPEDVFAV